MLLPFVLGKEIATAGVLGAINTISGAKKMHDANDIMQSTNRRHEKGMKRLEKQYQLTEKDINSLGELELKIVCGFNEFADVFEQIKNRPVFESYSKNGFVLPAYEIEEIKKVSIKAGLLLGGLGGGILLNIVGGKMLKEAKEARKEMLKAEDKINIICRYLAELRSVSVKYYETLSKTNEIYQKHFKDLKYNVRELKHTDWNTFTSEEKRLIENTVLLVGLLYNMCKIEIVLKGKSEDELNTINKVEVEKTIDTANAVIADKQAEAGECEKKYWIVEENTHCEEYELDKNDIPIELMDYIGYKEYVELDDYIVWSDYNGLISSYELNNKSVRFFENKNTKKMDASDKYKIYNKNTKEYSSFSLYSVSHGSVIGKPYHNKIIYRYLHELYVYDVISHKNNCIYEDLSSIYQEFSVDDNRVAFINASEKIVVLNLSNNEIVFEKKITTSVLLRSYDICLWNGNLFYEENRKIMKYDFITKRTNIVYEYHVPEKDRFLADVERFMYIQKMICSKNGLYIVYWDKNEWKEKILKISPDNNAIHIECECMPDDSHIWILEDNLANEKKQFLLMFKENTLWVLNMINDKITVYSDDLFPQKANRDQFKLVLNTLYWGEEKEEPSFKVDLIKKWKPVELNPMCI